MAGIFDTRRFKPKSIRKDSNIIISDTRTINRRMMGDKDKDGVPNAFDCEPNNPRKQGLLDDIRMGIRRRISERRDVSKIRREAAFEERKVQAAKTAIEIERIRGQRRVKEAKKPRPSFFQGAPIPIFPRQATPVARIGKKKGKKKGKKGRRITVREASETPFRGFEGLI